MKQKRFFDVDHADRYLSSSVIRVGGDPVFVNRVLVSGSGNQPTLYYWNLGAVGGSAKLKQLALYHADVDLNPVPLGMLSQDGDINAACYITRVPRRAWKIGLTTTSLNCGQVSSKAEEYIRFGKSGVLYSNALKNTINNQYPSIKQAAIMSKDLSLPIAFSRKFAIWMDRIYYKDLGYAVGEKVADSIVLKDEFHWLKEMVEEVVHG